ncbi:hypothetical protein C1X61_05075 [Pseudomonas sp. FW215-T2]|nr:hypothetical protein C1X61_05075 [Pseudomonas sp. FW215-T2]PNA14554.1 hypothetical protein C1X62_06455 [Pseudomonas sp. FW215-R3]
MGASLLAIAVCQATQSLDFRSLSRASSLPQWLAGARQAYVSPAFPASDTRTCQGPARVNAVCVRRGRSCAARR